MLDLTNVTVEELNTISIDAAIKNGYVILDPSTYIEKDGIRYFHKPLKVEYDTWAFSTLDCISLAKYFYQKDIYIFAMSINKDFNEKLGEIYIHNGYKDRGYDFFNSFTSSEVDAID